MLNNIQNLRALAAYAVVIHHCVEGYFGYTYLYVLSGGVDLFFVISGFVMVFTTKSNETPFGFTVKRIARIVPLYWAMTLFVVAITMVRPWGFSASDIAPESIFATLFFVPYPNLNGDSIPILPPGWTLNYEMYFYVLFALSLALPRRFRVAGVIAFLAAIWVLCQFGGANRFAQHYGNAIVFEFAVGCIVACVLRLPAVAAFARATPMWPIAVAALAAVAVAPFVFQDFALRLRTILPFGVLVFAAAAQDLYRTPARETLVTRLGDASYSAYLAHTVIMALIGMGVGVLTKGAMELQFWPFLGMVCVSTAVLSLILAQVFERPSASFVRKLFNRPPKIAAHP
ncbi:MAG: acyltransferase [Hyphomonadaceae bacterium]|nr:acyltransferase [Hyphomonadaceae bacterium]MBP9234432.1 acyltransferase [Hyphomonadaceae bacterium]